MCGRYTATKPENKFRKDFGLKPKDGLFTARYNIAPTQAAPVVTNDLADDIQLFTWGLIPHWTKNKTIGNKLINARAETLQEKPSFRDAFRKRRCLVLADSFYEWAELEKGQGRVPQRISLQDESVFAFAGLWETWKPADGAADTHTFTIITTSSNELLKPIHDRMPVILTPEMAKIWLDMERSTTELQKLFEPFDSSAMKFYSVSTAVNSPRNDFPELIAPASAE